MVESAPDEAGVELVFFGLVDLVFGGVEEWLWLPGFHGMVPSVYDYQDAGVEPAARPVVVMGPGLVGPSMIRRERKRGEGV